MSKKRILIFSLSYHPLVGGAEVAIKEITERIPDFEFDMVTLRFAKRYPKFEKIGSVNIYRVGGGLWYLFYLKKVFFILQATIFAYKLTKNKKYDAFWAMMTYMLLPITLMRLLGNRTPYLLTLQDGDPFTHVFNRLRIVLWKPLLSYGFRHAMKVQTISNFLASWPKEMGYKGKVEVIPNGVDVERFTKTYSQDNVNHEIKKEIEKKDSQIILISTSRLVKKNGLSDIILALKFLPENIRFINLGGGPERVRLAKLIKSIGLENRASLLGNYGNDLIPRFLQYADIFVRPSLSEGFGISFIEAMAAGLPVIATPVGGIPDFLEDGETGVFCKVRDPKSIADAVMRLTSDPELASKIKRQALEMVKEKYDWSIVAREMERIFNGL